MPAHDRGLDSGELDDLERKIKKKRAGGKTMPATMVLTDNNGQTGRATSIKKYAFTGGMLLKDGKPPIANDEHGDAQLADEAASLIVASGGTVDRAAIEQSFKEKYSLYQPTKGRMGGIIDTGYQKAVLERQQQPAATTAAHPTYPSSPFGLPGARGTDAPDGGVSLAGSAGGSHSAPGAVGASSALASSSAAAAVQRHLRQARVREEEVDALRRENADLRRRNGALERRMAAALELLVGSDDGADEDGSDDLIDEDVDGVLV